MARPWRPAPREGKGRVRMTVVHEMHHRRRPGSAMMVGMDMVDDGGAKRSGKVLVLPPAPDAIELRHLRAFVAVAEELNFGRAATRLFLSQPALSRQIRGLERLVGCDLLRRSTHRVELTLAGDALLDRARRLLSDLDDAVYATRSVGGDLERRLAAVWEPINDLTAASPDLQALRDAGEQLHGQFELAPGIVGAAGDRRWRAVAAGDARGRRSDRRSCCCTAAAS